MALPFEPLVEGCPNENIVVLALLESLAVPEELSGRLNGEVEVNGVPNVLATGLVKSNSGLLASLGAVEN